MPNLQQITLSSPGIGHRYVDGEDPDEEVAAEYADWPTHDIEIISNFRKLRILEVNAMSNFGSKPFLLNGRYPFLFNNFPLLQKLTIKHCKYLKWDLEVLAGLPSLEGLDFFNNHRLTGNINSLRVLNDTLEKVKISRCENVEGNFMDLADFPHLKELDLEYTTVTGDIRDVSENDFTSLERLTLPKGVYGGVGYEFQRISDAPGLIRAVYLFIKQHPALIMKYWFGDFNRWYGVLSENSPDWYDYPGGDEEEETPPFLIVFVQVGARLGYRWRTNHGILCEVNWLDPEPDRESSDYAKYIEELQEINCKVNMYKGFHQPPTEEEYNRLYEEYAAESPFADESDEGHEDFYEYDPFFDPNL